MSSIMHKIVLALEEIYCRVQLAAPCFFSRQGSTRQGRRYAARLALDTNESVRVHD